MAGSTPPPRIPLPRGWPQRVRSAVIHAISLAHFSLTSTRSWAANSWNARIRLKTENDRLRQEVALLIEEMRIKDARMLRTPAQRRPHYPPIERLAILELRAARGWSLSQTARRLLVTPATVASWMGHLDEEGPRAIVQVREPVNRFPDFVRYMVQRLKVLCPTMGKVKIAQLLCTAGLHLAPTTVARMLLEPPPGRSRSQVRDGLGRLVTAKGPNHVWLSDLTTVPTSLGFWCAWLPFSLVVCRYWIAPQSRSFSVVIVQQARNASRTSHFGVDSAQGGPSGRGARVRFRSQSRGNTGGRSGSDASRFRCHRGRRFRGSVPCSRRRAAVNRAVPDPGQARRGRHGCRLRGRAAEPQTQGCAEGRPRWRARRRGPRQAVPARGRNTGASQAPRTSAAIYESGRTEDGQHFFAMELDPRRDPG